MAHSMRNKFDKKEITKTL